MEGNSPPSLEEITTVFIADGISDQNRSDDDPELIDVVTGKRIQETQERNR